MQASAAARLVRGAVHGATAAGTATSIQIPPVPGRAGLLPEAHWPTAMAAAQAGDRDAYARLLHAILPRIRAQLVAAMPHGQDLEQAAQEVLRSVHALRHTCDPARPFGPWLAALVQHRAARDRDRPFAIPGTVLLRMLRGRAPRHRPPSVRP